MPGRPILNALLQKIEQRYGKEGESGLQVLLDRFSALEKVDDMAKELGCSTGLLYTAFQTDRAAYARAKEIKGLVMAQRAQEVLEEAVPTAIEINRAKEVANIMKWRAIAYNKEELGEKPAQVSLQLNVGDLHLTALRELSRDMKRQAIEGVDFEMVERKSLRSSQEGSE